MTYQLKDICNTGAMIAESDNIADLWQALDKQHRLLLPSLVIVKGDEIVAGEVGLLERIKAPGSVDFLTVAGSI